MNTSYPGSSRILVFMIYLLWRNLFRVGAAIVFCLCVVAGATAIAADSATQGAASVADANAVPPDEAAQEALKDLRYNLDHAENGLWKTDIDPALQFLNKYTGLGSDAVTVLSLNQMDKIWPSWKGAATGLTNFGVAYSVYNCLQNAYNGNYNRATLEGLKDFIKYRVGQMGSTAAVSASGVGLIDFALNSFGEAATAQIKEDFWTKYCQYQAEQRPHLSNYIDLITTGKNGRKGLEAVTAALDSFWTTEESAGIRGFYNLETNTPDYQQQFRNRFIKEQLLYHLQLWAGREQEKAEFEAYRAAYKLTEAVMNTKVVVELTILDRNLNAPPAGTAEIAVAFDNPHTTTVLAKQPIGQPLHFEVPLKALWGADKRLTGHLFVQLRLAGYPEEPNTTGQNVFDVDLADCGPRWVRSVQPGTIICKSRKPFYVENWSDVRFVLDGDPRAVQELSSLELRGVPPPTAGELRALARMPDNAGVSLKNGQGSVRLKHGRYLVTARSGDYIFSGGTIVVDGPGTQTIHPSRVAAADADAPALPSLDALRAQLGNAVAAARQHAAGYLGSINIAAASLQDYWQRVQAAQIERARTRRALELKLQDELKPPNLTSEQQQSIQKKYRPRIDALQKEDETFNNSSSQILNQTGSDSNALETERGQQRSAAINEMRSSEDELRLCAGNLGGLLYPIERDFVNAIAPVTSGILESYHQAGEVDAILEKARASLASIEQKLPALLKEYEKLPALVDRHTAAVNAVVALQELDETEIYHNVALDRYGEEADLLVQRIESLRNAGLLEEAREYLKKGERIVERRRARSVQVAQLRRQIEETIAQMPAPDTAAWTVACKGFSDRAGKLFAAVTSGTSDATDDTPAFNSIQADMERFMAQQAIYAGDLLAQPARTETAFSRFVDLHEKLVRLNSQEVMPPEFPQVVQSGWNKINQRYATAGTILGVRDEISNWLAFGKTAADRRTRLASLVGVLTAVPDPAKADTVDQRIARLEERRQALDAVPHRFRPQTARRTYEAERRALVRGGLIEDRLLPAGGPRLVFKTIEGEALGKTFFWPESVPEKSRGQDYINAVLSVEGIDPDLYYSVQFSGDGGRSWSTRSGGDDLHVNLPFDPRGAQKHEILYRITLPSGQVVTTPASLPQYCAPSTL